MAADPNNISSYAQLTPQQLLELVLGLIIDNNIMAVTPKKVRDVLIPIIASYAGRTANISATDPVQYNAFNGVISMLRASASQSGYLHKDDFASFASGSGSISRLAWGTFRHIGKGQGNSNLAINEVGDLFEGGLSSGEWCPLAVWQGGALDDEANFLVGPTFSIPTP